MKIKKTLSLVVIAVLIAIFVIAVAERLNNTSFVSSSASPKSGENVTGTLSNLSFTFNPNASITNISIMWQLSKNSSEGGSANHSFMINTTYRNGTNCGLADCANRTYWNSTFDTNTLLEGIYNISIQFHNGTTGNGSGGVGGPFTNFSVAEEVGVDNTKPRVRILSTNNQAFSIHAGLKNITFRVEDLFIQTAARGQNPAMVILSFDNSTGNDFNISVKNYSGEWRNATNISALHAGTHVVTVVANDSMGNKNASATLTFTLNTPPNVTLNFPSPGIAGGPRYNVSAKNATTYFNITVWNATSIHGSGILDNESVLPNADIVAAILMFDNATGNAFNISNGSNLHGGLYFNFSYNLSELEEGINNITVFVNDTVGNLNKTEVFHVLVDKSGPTVTVTCTSSPAPGTKVSCSCSATDSGVGIKHGAKFVGDTDAAEETTAGSAGETGTSSTCKATDALGNVGSGTGSWTVGAEATSGSGDSSGGGSPSGVPSQFSKNTWSSLSAAETAVLNVKNGEIGIVKVEFTVKEKTYGAWVSVTKKKAFPASVSSFTGKEYKKLQFLKGSALKDDTTTDGYTIDFKVTNKWMTDNGLTKGEVAMHRFADGKWSQLATTLGEDDGTYTHYTAKTPGFSYFVIGEKEAAAAPIVEGAPAEAPAEGEAAEDAVEAADAPAEGEAMMEKEGGSMAVVWIILAVLIIGGLLWWFLRKK
tara:strand:- start:2154 stop:4274 length:2121 start_codon:yes stop_codon:yes gene_type:complete